MSYANLPHKVTIPIQVFTIKTPDSELSDLKLRLASARLPTAIYDNVQTEDDFGVTSEWINTARNHWFERFNWYVPLLHPSSRYSWGFLS